MSEKKQSEKDAKEKRGGRLTRKDLLLCLFLFLILLAIFYVDIFGNGAPAEFIYAGF